MSAKPHKNEPDKRKPKDPDERIRKIGERDEIVEIKLTQIQIEDMRMEVMILLDDEERIEEKSKEAKKVFDGQLKTNQLQRNELRRVITAGKRRETVAVEEYLTASNEVVRVRKDTGDKIGLRIATRAELQEELPLAKPADPPAQQSDALQGDGFPAPDNAFGAEAK